MRSRSRSGGRGGGGGYKGQPVTGKNNVLFVAGLDQGCKKNELQRWIEEQGFDVEAVDIPMDPSRGVTKGYGFVDLRNSTDVDDAVRTLSGKNFNGRQIKVEQKQSRVYKRQNTSSRSRGGGGGYGRGRSRGRGRSDSRGGRRGGGGGGRRRDSRSR